MENLLEALISKSAFQLIPGNADMEISAPSG